MKPVFATNDHDSLRACVASMFERQLRDMPAIDLHCEEDTWLARLNRWTEAHFSCKWACTYTLLEGQQIWTPPGWYIEALEKEGDPTQVAFQVCSGGVTMHRPFTEPFESGVMIVRARLWLVVVDPAVAWPPA